MTLNQMLYIVGSVVFIGMLLYSMRQKEADTGELLIKFKLEPVRMAPTLILLVLVGMLMTMEYANNTRIVTEIPLVLAFWFFFAVFQFYLSVRPRVIMSKGIGSCDFRGKIQRDFFEWSEVERYDMGEKSITFVVRGPKGLFNYKMGFDPRLHALVEKVVKDQFKGGKKKKK